MLGILSSERYSDIWSRAANEAITKGVLYRNDPHGRDDERSFDAGELNCNLKWQYKTDDFAEDCIARRAIEHRSAIFSCCTPCYITQVGLTIT